MDKENGCCNETKGPAQAQKMVPGMNPMEMIANLATTLAALQNKVSAIEAFMMQNFSNVQNAFNKVDEALMGGKSTSTPTPENAPQ